MKKSLKRMIETEARLIQIEMINIMKEVDKAKTLDEIKQLEIRQSKIRIRKEMLLEFINMSDK